MKSPHYAAGVTALYRKYIDYYREWDAAGRKTPWKIAAEDMRQLRSLYLRADLSTGYYYKRNGKELLTIGKPGYAGTDEDLLQRIEEKYLREMPRRAISGTIGKPFFSLFFGFTSQYPPSARSTSPQWGHTALPSSIFFPQFLQYILFSFLQCGRTEELFPHGTFL